MSAPRTIRLGAFIAGGLVVALALAFFVGPRASRDPDGLDRVAIDHGLDTGEEAHALAHGPTAGYAVRGVHDDGLSTGLAGLLGVTVTFAVGGGLVLLMRRRRPTVPAAPHEVGPGAG